ncbi:MAG TPA: DNA primase [Candidatus Saccharimonadales bacterium]
MDARDEVKNRLSIEDVISGYIELKRAGRNWKALSPFTSEKSASFIVSPDKQIWHDFSSGKGGDVFSFVMEVEGIDFRAALELLARKAGVDLDQYDNKDRAKSNVNKSRLYDLLELSAKFYQVQFSKNKTALGYVLNKRKFTKATALAWQIGYSPNTGNAVVKFLKENGFNVKEIQQSGLSSSSYPDRDMFRGRLMIPLHDGQGRVIGYTARLLEDDDNAPKYINTPQTVLYDKSRHIFGLHLAKQDIRKSGFVVVVEGNLDVIASHQASVCQVVATAGTALTSQHLKILSRLTNDIRLCFDADKAGLSATERAIPLASKEKLNLSIIDIPSGKDPDELIKVDEEAWKKIIDEPIYALDWLITYYQTKFNLESAPGKRQYSDLLAPLIKSLSDDVERDHYINVLAKLTNVSPGAITSKVGGVESSTDAPRKRFVKKDFVIDDKTTIEHHRMQDNFLCLVLVRKTLREFLDILTDQMLFTEQAKELLALLKANPEIDVRDDAAKFKKIADYVKIELLLYEELYDSLDLNELHYEAARLQARLIEIYVKSQKDIITKSLNTSDQKATRQLLEEAKKLDQLLNQSKGENII